MHDLHLALLRGVNVGGKNRLPMAELTALFVAAGCADVETCIQSGNVVFRAAPAAAAAVIERVEASLAERFGHAIPVVLRTAAELADAVAANPFLKAGVDPDLLHVAFLGDLPDPERVAALDPQRSPPDEFAVVGREIYLFLPNGVARTRLTNAWFDAKLGTVSTVRNWRTVEKLQEMAGRKAP